MMKDILAERGYMFLGSRLKRLADRLQGDAVKILERAGLEVQPGQLPLLIALDRHGPQTVNGAAEMLGVSQPGVTRTVSALAAADLVAIDRDAGDQRRRTIRLTEQGRNIVERAQRLVSPRVEAAAIELCAGLSGDFLDQVTAIEAKLERFPFEERVLALPAAHEDAPLSIVEFSDELAGDFYRINAEWIETMFAMEENDRRVLEDPRGTIVDRGGIVLFVRAPDLGIIGTCALRRSEEGCYELTKMGVLASARGRKAGDFLLAHILERAREMRMKRLYLLTNTACAAAIHLYEKFGFEHDAEIMRLYGQRYARSNVAMSFPLDVG